MSLTGSRDGAGLFDLAPKVFAGQAGNRLKKEYIVNSLKLEFGLIEADCFGNKKVQK